MKPSLFLLLFLSISSFFLGIYLGSSEISFGEVLSILTGKPHPKADIVLQLRLPRVLLAMATGSILSLCGFYIQALVKNPLADPYLMGVTSGASLGVNLLYANLITISSFHLFTFPLFAWAGSFVALLLVMALGAKGFSENNDRLLLAGVACSSICTAITGVLIYRFAESDQMRRMFFWTFGSFERATPEICAVALILLLGCIVFGTVYSRKLDILSLGDVQALTLGIDVTQIKYIMLIAVSIFAGGIVAFTGPIGFVGMMIPHFSRAFVGYSHRHNLLIATILGATYLNLCDILSRLIFPPTGLPIGITTALLGVPFFLYLLYKKNTF
ncbi:MAG: FecCD family ABC transporter permease [Bacteroidia bacterium]